MYFVKSFIVFAAAAALASATPGVNKRAEAIARDNCGGNIGDCFQNGCSPDFGCSSATIGTCTAGAYDGCPCFKCGSGIGYVGSCSAGGCNGFAGTCTGGTYEGCPCEN